MSLGLSHALAEDARELREEHDKSQKKSIYARRQSLRDPSPLRNPNENETTTTQAPPGRRASIASDTAGIADPSPTKPEANNSSIDDLNPLTPASPNRPTGGEIDANLISSPRLAPKSVSSRAMASVYGKNKPRLPGDLGPGDPRRSLPGDLGPNDPRRARSLASKSQSPAGRTPEGAGDSRKPRTRPRRASDGALLKPEGEDRLRKDRDEPGEESSEDEYEGDVDSAAEGGRGRGRARSARVGSSVGSDSEDDEERGRTGTSSEHCP